MVNGCYLCGREETADHTLIHCGWTSTLWSLLFALFGVCWVLPSTAKEVLSS